MPTTVITGRDLALTINSVSYDAQATSVALAVEQTREIYQTLDGRAYKVTDANSTLTVEMLADWGATGVLAMWLWYTHSEVQLKSKLYECYGKQLATAFERISSYIKDNK